MSESYQTRLSRVRKPRVHITYDVDTEGARIEKELPFVVGVLGDFAGDPTNDLPELAERKFTTIDRDTFNTVMAQIAPGLNLRVKNTLGEDDSELAVNLKFQSLQDFAPAKVAEQVPELRALLETRAKLSDLMSKVNRSQKLEELLKDVLKDKSKLASLSAELGRGGEGDK